MVQRPSNISVTEPIWHLHSRVSNVVLLLSEEKITLREARKRVRAIIDDYEVDVEVENPFLSSGGALSGPNSIDGVMLP